MRPAPNGAGLVQGGQSLIERDFPMKIKHVRLTLLEKIWKFNFHDSGVNSRSCAFLQSTFFNYYFEDSPHQGLFGMSNFNNRLNPPFPSSGFLRNFSDPAGMRQMNCQILKHAKFLLRWGTAGQDGYFTHQRWIHSVINAWDEPGLIRRGGAPSVSSSFIILSGHGKNGFIELFWDGIRPVNLFRWIFWSLVFPCPERIASQSENISYIYP